MTDMDRRNFFRLTTSAALATVVPAAALVACDEASATVLPFDGRIVTCAKWPDLVEALRASLLNQLDAHLEMFVEPLALSYSPSAHCVDDDAIDVDIATLIDRQERRHKMAIARAKSEKDRCGGLRDQIKSATEFPLRETGIYRDDERLEWTTNARRIEQTNDGKWIYCQWNEYIMAKGPKVGHRFTAYEVSEDQSGIRPEDLATV